MKNQQKEKFPLVAALLKSKVLKEIQPSSSKSWSRKPSFVVRGHELMNMSLVFSECPLFQVLSEGRLMADADSEAIILLNLFELTWESTQVYAREQLIKILTIESPLLAFKFAKLTKL